MNACLSRKSSAKMLSFNRADYPDVDPAADPISIDPDNPELCTGCNQCVNTCEMDLGAISLRHPLMNQVHWKEIK